MPNKSSGSYGEKLPYKLPKSASSVDKEIAKNSKDRLNNTPAVTENQDVYASVHMDKGNLD
jgi:hypothetical protein